MKIVYCISAMYKSGGIERVITNKANYFVQKGHEVVIITTDQGDAPYFFPLDSRVQRIDLGLNYHQLDSLPTWKRLLETWKKKPIHKKLLTDTLMQLKANYVVSVGRQEVSFLPSIQDGSKKIWELHTSKYAQVRMYPAHQKLKRAFGYLRVWNDERIARRYTYFISLTQEEKDLWKSVKNVRVIPNACSFSTTDYAALENKEVITAGRFEYVKNYTELIDIWAEVAKEAPDWTLRLCGSGWLEGQLREQIARLRLEKSVIITPSTPKILDFYRNASIYVLTSHFEGLPMVLLEAQAVGLPIVAYQCQSGPKDIVSHGKDGFLVPLYNKKNFADRLLTLIHGPELRKRMGHAAVQSSTRFSEPAVMALWEKLLEE